MSIYCFQAVLVGRCIYGTLGPRLIYLGELAHVRYVRFARSVYIELVVVVTHSGCSGEVAWSATLDCVEMPKGGGAA